MLLCSFSSGSSLLYPGFHCYRENHQGRSCLFSFHHRLALCPCSFFTRHPQWNEPTTACTAIAGELEAWRLCNTIQGKRCRHEWWWPNHYRRSQPLRRACSSPLRGATTSQNHLRDRTPLSLPATEAPTSAPIATPPSRRAVSFVMVFDWSGGFDGGNCRSSSPPTSRYGRISPGFTMLIRIEEVKKKHAKVEKA
ncbi:uncharacterized protein DS421_7g205610 [Arachis hypogaea]|nr:uncharacterized protein DS421_7g205610 [Arachis hypogaea]